LSLAKLNCRDVAKDFGMQAKAITAILAEHTKENVSPTKILTDRELSIIFEHLTQKNQVDSIESIYADVYHEPAPAKPAAPAAQPAGSLPGAWQYFHHSGRFLLFPKNQPFKGGNPHEFPDIRQNPPLF